ncbi:hypothetical protein M1437_04900 [Patescibacteria group bacterium]|nr:hypothetical protein [Patescibacteria group bacterium]
MSGVEGIIARSVRSPKKISFSQKLYNEIVRQDYEFGSLSVQDLFATNNGRGQIISFPSAIFGNALLAMAAEEIVIKVVGRCLHNPNTSEGMKQDLLDVQAQLELTALTMRRSRLRR